LFGQPDSATLSCNNTVTSRNRTLARDQMMPMRRG
jgi:hypothetical protein